MGLDPKFGPRRWYLALLPWHFPCVSFANFLGSRMCVCCSSLVAIKAFVLRSSAWLDAVGRVGFEQMLDLTGSLSPQAIFSQASSSVST